MDEKLTLMLNSFHRIDLMKRSVRHYQKCSSIVHQIRVIWCEEEDPPESSIDRDGVAIIYDVMNGTSLNNRFVPIKGFIQTFAEIK